MRHAREELPVSSVRHARVTFAEDRFFAPSRILFRSTMVVYLIGTYGTKSKPELVSKRFLHKVIKFIYS